MTSMRVYHFYTENARRSWLSYIYPGVIEVLVFIITLWAYIVIIKDFIEWYLLKKRKKKDLIFKLFDEQETIRKVEMAALNTTVFRPDNIENTFKIDEMPNKEKRKQLEKERKIKEREKQFQEEVKLTKEENEFLDTMKKQNLPNKREAIDIIHEEFDFVRFQKAMKDDDRFRQEIDPAKLKIY